ncbi:MAG: hypothetical protein ACTHN5_20140 [Phycisphaerae bacterium]
MVDCKTFWKLRDAYEEGAPVAVFTDRLDHENNTHLISGTFRGKLPINCRCESLLRSFDLIGTGWHNRYLLSERVVDVLSANRLRGWSTYPVKMVDPKGDEIHGYFGLSITGRGGPIDKTKRDIVGESRTGRCLKTKGVSFDEKNWDGSDIFLVGNTAHICANQRAYEALSAINPLNMRFDRLDQVRGIQLKTRIRL